MNERLRASDYRFILICAALLGATTWFSVRNFYRAFPEAAIRFKVSRDDARNVAGTFPAPPTPTRGILESWRSCPVGTLSR